MLKKNLKNTRLAALPADDARFSLYSSGGAGSRIPEF
jgi:hypothetical protein